MAIKKTGKKTKRDSLKSKLDACMPIGVKAALHRDPNAQISDAYLGQLNAALKSDIDGGGGANGFEREANIMGGSSPSVGRTPLLYVDPLFDPILFLFPKDRIDEINKRLRHYFETDPIVGNAIELHASSPLQDFYLECEDPDIEQYWNDFKDRTNLIGFLHALLIDYWLLGEGIGLPIWDPINFEFSHFNQYPPENVDIFRTYVTPTSFFLLKPDPSLAKKVGSGKQIDQTLTNMMDKDYLKSLQEGKPYVLGSDKKVIYLSRSATKYRHRGLSILTRCLKDLLYKDKLRLLQLTFVDRHMFPIKVFKLGSESKGWIPSQRHFKKLQMLLAQAANDPDFNILYHFGLEIDYVGTKDKVWNLIPEFEWVEKQCMAALFVNEEIIHGGVPSAVRDTVNLRTLMHRYMAVRSEIERVMMTHIFLPIAQARGFYRKDYLKNKSKYEKKLHKTASNKEGREVDIEWIDKEKGLYRIANSVQSGVDMSRYDLPRPIWKKINLINNAQEQEFALNMEEAGKLPLDVIHDMMGFDPRIIKKKMHAQESTYADPVWRQVREDVAREKDVRKQVLKGKKHDSWYIGDSESAEDGEEEKEKPEPKERKIPKSSPPPAASPDEGAGGEEAPAPEGEGGGGGGDATPAGPE